MTTFTGAVFVIIGALNLAAAHESFLAGQRGLGLAHLALAVAWGFQGLDHLLRAA